MLRATVLAALALIAPHAVGAQTLTTLHIKIVLTDTDGKTMPVPRHALLISDNPSTTTPRRVVTGVDGTADVRLRPGNYTVESDEPVVLRGTAYQWTKIIDIVAGRDFALELTAANADSQVAGTTSSGDAGRNGAQNSAPPLEAEPAFLLPRWQDSVVALWTPTARASAVVVDAKGLIATNQRAVGSATSAEVQLSPSVKVAARVLAADPTRNVAIVWIDPSVIASVKPVPLGCAQPKTAAEKQEIFAIGVPFRHEKDVTSGTLSDLVLTSGTDGGPVFTADGGLVGITSPPAKSDENRRASAQVVKVADVCEAVASAEKKMANASPPPSTHLPVEPGWPLPVDAFKNAADHRVGSLNPYQLSTSTFDVAFITPIMTYGVQYQSEQMSRRRKGKDGRTIDLEPVLVKPVMDFGNWFEYVEDFPSVLLVRVTPRQVESVWAKVARGAAYTQGAAIPPITRAKSSFSRLRAYCGDTEVTPIHPLTVEHRLSDTEAAYEGLYVFDPKAFSPSCASVKFVVYSEKNPDRPETGVVDPRIVQQITDDFGLYR
jgi:S1-C subfamily serine protease